MIELASHHDFWNYEGEKEMHQIAKKMEPSICSVLCRKGFESPCSGTFEGDTDKISPHILLPLLCYPVNF